MAIIAAVAFDLGQTLIYEERSQLPIEVRAVRLMPAVKEVLAEIDLPLAVWANTRSGGERDVRSRLRSAGIDRRFDFVITSQEAGARKPALQFFAYALARCGWQKDEVLFVCNQLNTDVVGANLSGIASVRLSGDEHRSADETFSLADVTPTYQIDSLCELPALLQQINKITKLHQQQRKNRKQ